MQCSPPAAAAVVYVVFTVAFCWGTSGICGTWLQALCGCQGLQECTCLHTLAAEACTGVFACLAGDGSAVYGLRRAAAYRFACLLCMARQ